MENMQSLFTNTQTSEKDNDLEKAIDRIIGHNDIHEES